MNFEQFQELMLSHEYPVVLLEGMRELPDRDHAKLVALAQFLAAQWPHVRFRTGNASGSDEAFAAGVCAVDAARLEYVLPHQTMRAGSRHADSPSVAYESLDAASQKELEVLTIRASPKYKTLIEDCRKVRKLAIKSNYLLRDTMKVTGHSGFGLRPATLGIFYVNLEKAGEGGTAHTIRVCEQMQVPVVTQNQWLAWPIEYSKE